eukprot:955385-Amphidinium_carterae.2
MLAACAVQGSRRLSLRRASAEVFTAAAVLQPAFTAESDRPTTSDQVWLTWSMGRYARTAVLDTPVL